MVVSQLANKTSTIDVGTTSPAAAESIASYYCTSWATDSTNHVNFSNELLTDELEQDDDGVMITDNT